jgi:hypothetical protein
LLCAAVRWPHLFHRQHKVCHNFPHTNCKQTKLPDGRSFFCVFLYRFTEKQEFIVWICISKLCVGLSACPYCEWTVSGSILWSMVLFRKVIVTHFMNKHPTFHETWRFITTVTNICH